MTLRKPPPQSQGLPDRFPTGNPLPGDYRICLSQLCTLRGKPCQIRHQALSTEQDWQEKYIEVQLILDQPEVGIANEIREVFLDRDSEILVVEAVVTDSIVLDAWTNSVVSQSPLEVFDQFRRTKILRLRPRSFS